MRNTAFVVLGLFLLVFQSTVHIFVDRIHVGIATPSLLLPLLIFMGVHEYSLGRGAALSFILGYFNDLFVGAPLGLFTMLSVASFWLARIAGVRLAAQTFLTKIALAFVFALVEGGLVVFLTAIVGNDPLRARSVASMIPAHAISTAVAAPFVFYLVERIHLATSGSQAAEGQPRA